MKFFQSLITLSVAFICACCNEDEEPKGNPCQVVHENGYVFDTGNELVDGVCSCPADKFSAYGTCRELKVNEWYGISTDCPCADTLFLWLKKFEGSNKSEFLINEDVFDPANLDLEYASTAARLRGSAQFDYFSNTEGDSIAPADLASYISKCEIPGTGPEFDEVTIFGRLTPDNDTLFAKFIYRDGGNRLIVLDSCNVIFTK
jgi:hypothetical protein